MNISIRGLTPETDFSPFLELTHAIERDHSSQAAGTELTSAEQLRSSWMWPRTKRWVAEAVEQPGILVGASFLFAQIKERSALHLKVHPAWRRMGIGSQLLAHLLVQARETGADWANFEIDEREQGCIDFLMRRGFQVVSDTWVMRAPETVLFEVPVWPDGYTVRTYADVNDLVILAQACNLSFQDLWGHHENTRGGVNPESVAQWSAKVDQRGIFLVFGPEGAAGFCRAESGALTGEGEDLLDQPGVAPAHRARGLHKPLALTAARWLRSQGTRPIRLESWGDSPATAAQYQELGFQLIEHGLALRKRLDPPSSV